jgi:hypothetical protein
VALRRMPRRVARSQSWLVAAVLLGLGATCAAAAAEPVDPWATGAEWFTVRAGYAKSTAAGAADGNVGFGFAYTRFHNSKWAYGATAEWDVLGRFGSARELEVPWTLEVSRHYKWPAMLRPYMGLGFGAYYHQLSGTGADNSTVVPGGYIGTGFNTPISDRGLFGVDVRMNLVGANSQDNPVFGGAATANQHQSRVFHWSAKLGYAWVF